MTNVLEFEENLKQLLPQFNQPDKHFEKFVILFLLYSADLRNQCFKKFKEYISHDFAPQHLDVNFFKNY